VVSSQSREVNSRTAPDSNVAYLLSSSNDCSIQGRTTLQPFFSLDPPNVPSPNPDSTAHSLRSGHARSGVLADGFQVQEIIDERCIAWEPRASPGLWGGRPCSKTVPHLNAVFNQFGVLETPLMTIFSFLSKKWFEF
jgi:hypothetical protein